VMTSSSVGWNLNPGGRNRSPPCSDLILRSTMIDLNCSFTRNNRRETKISEEKGREKLSLGKLVNARKVGNQ